MENKIEGAEFVAKWIRSYARRICTNDATGNKTLDEYICSDSLLNQAVQFAGKTEIEEITLAQKFQAWREKYGQGNGKKYWEGLEKIAKEHYSSN